MPYPSSTAQRGTLRCAWPGACGLRWSALLLSCALVGAYGEDTVSFQEQIQPILEKTCYSCHGVKKQKGHLRLDSPQAITTGGKNGAVVVAGNPGRSPMYSRLILSKDDDDVMPAKGDQLTNAQCELIRRWIAAGAVFATTTGAAAEASGPGKSGAPTALAGAAPASSATQPATILNGAGQPRLASAELPLTTIDAAAQGLPPVDAASVKALTGFAVVSAPISRNDAALMVDLSHGMAPLDKELAVVHRLGGNVFWLDLKGTAITNAQLHVLSGLTNLRRLHLERTAIGDEGLAALKPCVQLTYLNLYSTKVTDAGLTNLNGLTALEHLYLYQSQVTSVGVAKLQEALPKLIIDDAADLPAPPVEGATKKGKGKKK